MREFGSTIGMPGESTPSAPDSNKDLTEDAESVLDELFTRLDEIREEFTKIHMRQKVLQTMKDITESEKQTERDALAERLAILKSEAITIQQKINGINKLKGEKQ